ncbi:neutral/alkaline non-lysosomal ceramidase N-terminal domain-containing protein [Rhodopirellula sp.]|nr:neutral/alkaline non-lysosomal ceramidase N-terminal domain-containing protein [Rhodopirellula sp.]
MQKCTACGSRLLLSLCGFLITQLLVSPQEAIGAINVGAAIVDITPTQLPVLVNGGMLSRDANQIKTTINARAIAVSDGKESIAIVVVDSCMLPRILLDDAKQRASARTGINPENILVSATHTHSAPSSFGALGTEPDPNYVPFVRERIADAITQAYSRLQPAKVGWGSTDADSFTALRRWVRRPDRVEDDPFGNPTVRANMHAAKDLDSVTGPSGPEDPELSILAFESIDGKPIAALANFSMHYFSDQPISADYFGLFCEGLQQHVTKNHKETNFVGIMSHGCSGDIWRRDYMTWNGKDNSTIESYTQGLLAVATKLYDSIQFETAKDLKMAQAELPMDYRTPDLQRLEWSRAIVEKIENNTPKDTREVYAREQVLLNDLKETEILVQAIRIGRFAIASTPNETYALTGLKIKHQSPAQHTMVIELANGADGYIPPPEQHRLGGYNTWAARSAGLEVTAEPRIVSTNLGLLEKVCDAPRRPYRESFGTTASAILKQRPLAYWRFSESEAPVAIDVSPHQHHGTYEGDVCFFLEGPQNKGFTQHHQINRCIHLAGGRVRTAIDTPGDCYSILLNVWNGMPNDARGTSGWLFSRDHAHATSDFGEHLGVGGSDTDPGHLVFQIGNDEPLVGTSTLNRWRWHQILVVRESNRIRIYLDGQSNPEIDATMDSPPAKSVTSYFIGGRSDAQDNWQGSIDEVAFFDRALESNEWQTFSDKTSN